MGIKRKLLIGGLAAAVACPVGLNVAHAGDTRDTQPTAPTTSAATQSSTATLKMPTSASAPVQKAPEVRGEHKVSASQLAKLGLPAEAASSGCTPLPKNSTLGNATLCDTITPVTAGSGRPADAPNPAPLPKGTSLPKGGATTNGLNLLKSWPPSPSFIPTKCINNQHWNDGFWGSRNHMCVAQRHTLTIHEEVTNLPVGSLITDRFMYVKTDWKNHRYTVRFAMNTYGASGLMWTPGLLMMNDYTWCYENGPGTCRVHSKLGDAVPAALIPFASYTKEKIIEARADKGKKQSVDITSSMHVYFFQAAGVGGPVKVKSAMIDILGGRRTPVVRCDNLKSPAGCVMKGMDAYFNVNYNRKKSREWAVHVWQAQINKADHWGMQPGTRDSSGKVYNNGKPLSYLTDRSDARRNHDKTCPKPTAKERKKIAEGKSCDEYPFASTYQGGYFVGAARTSKRYIKKGHNSSGGGLTVNFYKKNRMRDGERFWVVVYNGPKS